MKEKNPYPHGFRLDKPIRMATDNVVGYIPQAEYSPVPPPIAHFFLLSDNTNFLLSDGSDFLLS
jgi:hypothetical protein